MYLTAFFLGTISALGALILESIFSIIIPYLNTPTLNNYSIYTIFFAVLIEEFFKFIIIGKIASQEKSAFRIFFDAWLVGIGFSLVEIILNIFSHPETGTKFFPAYIGLLLIHLATAETFGYYLATYNKRTFKNSSFFFFLAGLLHFCFNFAILHMLSYFIICITLLAYIIGIFFIFIKHKKIKTNFLQT